MSDIELEKHAKEYHNLTLNQFKLMCNEADKRYEGQFANAVDKHLAVECFYEGFKVAINNSHSWQGLSDDEILIICAKMAAKLPNKEIDLVFARAIEQALKEKNT
jgi:hypothetical protein